MSFHNLLLAINYPSFIKPEIIPGLPVRWYGLMYVFAFATAFLLFRRQVKERNFPMGADELSGLFTWGILGLLLGARIFACIVYEPVQTNIYFHKPWLIFFPFRDGRFTGFQGMSYHGGVIGCFLGVLLWSLKHKIIFREITDMLAASIPLGYTFGRLGNFFNAELYGRVTASPLGMIFPIPEWDTVNRFNPDLPWVREIADKTNITIPANFNGLVNLPRHPSQLYEALFEGIILWLIIWLLRKKNPFKGWLFGTYIAGYGIFRFIIEYFREPDADLGYRIQLGQVVGIKDIAHLHPLLSFSTGQILCLLMVVGAVIWWIVCYHLPGNKAAYFYPASNAPPGNSGVPPGAGRRAAQPDEQPKSRSEKNAKRNLRKKLK